jgi:hypothetical protein
MGRRCRTGHEQVTGASHGSEARSVVRQRRPKRDLVTRNERKSGRTMRRVGVEVFTARPKEDAGKHDASAQYHDRGRGVDGREQCWTGLTYEVDVVLTGIALESPTPSYTNAFHVQWRSSPYNIRLSPNQVLGETTGYGSLPCREGTTSQFISVSLAAAPFSISTPCGDVLHLPVTYPSTFGTGPLNQYTPPYTGK